MPTKFKVGDQVERIGSLVPSYMRHGIITKVIPSSDVGHDWLTEYEIDFGIGTVAICYEIHLRLVAFPRASSATSSN